MLDTVTLDVVILIQSFLPPLDILLVLRKTCRTLYNATRIRSVWLDAVRRTCCNNFVFLPSFPLPRMTLSELEHLATSPERYRSVLVRGATAEGCCLEPYARRTLIPRRVDQPSNATRFVELMIIPGGRFLFAMSSTAVYLWDLGFNANKMIQPRPLAVCDVDASPEGDSWCAGATPAGNKIEFLIGSFVDDGTKHTMYEVNPFTASPAIVEIGTHTWDFPDLRVGTICDGRVAFWSYAESIAGIWHLASDTTITWDVPQIQEMILVDDCATCCCDNRIDVFNINKLLPSASKPVSTHHDLKPVITHARNIDYVVRMFRWYTQDPHLMYFDTVDLNSSSKAFSRFHFQRPSPSDANVPNFVPVYIESIDLPPDVWNARRNRSSTNLKLLDNDVLFAWTAKDYEQLGVHMMQSPLSAKAGHRTVATRLLSDGTEVVEVAEPRAPDEEDEEEDDVPDFDFCPASGRLALLTDDLEITVLDYLMPPTC
ncbi:hypothetical protein BD626DRAFT_60081 [Schizophyllum amplum]|uniref:F-box domain-containing protein n=1 Tax=Schizophyllum amplum TaxID=97359 RepID=A0A550CC17_9AGAR|nr:hypothetical protein BD626DRAFT_60081 [Auriculariopsis ampla]